MTFAYEMLLKESASRNMTIITLAQDFDYFDYFGYANTRLYALQALIGTGRTGTYYWENGCGDIITGVLILGAGIYANRPTKVLNINKSGLDSIYDLDDLLQNPEKLSGVSGEELYDYLIKNGYDVQPLSEGSYKGVPF